MGIKQVQRRPSIGDGPAGMPHNKCGNLMIIASKKNMSDNYVLLNQGETSKVIRVPVNTLKDWRAKGGVKGPRSAVIGGKVMYRESDVYAWIDQQFDQPRTSVNSMSEFKPLGKRSLAA
jgi:hypothetical protein